MEKQASAKTLTRRELLVRAAQAGVGLAAGTALGSLAGCAPVASPPPPAQPTAGAAGAATSAPAVVKGQTMAVAMWTGPITQVVRDMVLPDFEKAHGVKVTIEEGGSADAIAKLRAAAPRPRHTVIGVDDQYIPEIRAEGLIVKLTAQDVPGIKELYPEYVYDDGHGLGISVTWNTLHYNTERIKTAPASYTAMWDPANKGRVVMETLFAGTAWQFLMVAAALATGKPIVEAQYQPEAAFPKLKELKANTHSIVQAARTVAPQMVQGDVWLMVTATRVLAPYIVKGAPIARAEPKEGSFMLMNTLALAANAPLQEQGKDFINRMLSANVQLEVAKGALGGPTNRNVQVPADLRTLVPSGPEDASKMIRLDWNNIIKNRARITDLWNTEIGS